ncbi:MAG: alpha/beta fold hydrolase [Ignavibacteriae bacterium]|nr:alpha/beta fold hydrolase [Ignavibacteriota bacterium]
MKLILKITVLLSLVLFFHEDLYSQKLSPNFQIIRKDTMIAMTDGIKLDVTAFYPDTTKPAAGWPAVIYCHGYGGSKHDYFLDAIQQAEEGYYCLCYTMRGQKQSEGLSNLISTTEMNDFLQVLNYTKRRTIVDSLKVGAMGASQGGTIPLMATCYYPLSNLLKSICSDVSSPEFATNWIENKSIKMSLLWSLSYPDSIARYTPQVKAYRNWILADTPDKWDSLAYYLPINRDFTNKLHDNIVPICFGLVWQDKFFNADGFLKNLGNISSAYRMYLGTFDAHGADPDQTETFFYDWITGEWNDYWLKGIQNHSIDSSKFMYAASTFPRTNYIWTWQRFYSNVCPPLGTQNVKFYLQPNGRLYNDEIYNVSYDTLGFVNDIKDSTMTMAEAVNREFTGAVFNSKFGKTQLIFDTKPLLSDTRMVGTPFVNIHYMPSTTIAQFNLQIWEIQPNGAGELITRANYTERNITPNVIRQLYFYGTAYAHTFKLGNTIRVIITNLDNTSYDPFLRTNPFVLPSLKKAKNVIYMNPYNPTYVRLPLIGFIPIGVNQISSNIPDKFSLSQNYPNPFNPSTIIKFSIPENDILKMRNDIVTLKVYNILGKEVATLVNERLQAGTYEVKFEGSNLPSGIYFYKLETEKYREVKRMILLK